MTDELINVLDKKFSYRKDLELAEKNGVEHEYVICGDKYHKKYKIVFHQKCSLCSKNVNTKTYIQDENVFCNYCKTVIANKKRSKEINELLEVKTKAEIRFEKAVDEIKNQVKDFYQYNNAIRIAKGRCEKYGSIPEAMVAIELLKLKYSIIPQQKVGKYRVDFALPRQKIIIEVDGSTFHKNDKKDLEREGRIQLMLGLDWKIVRISADMIRNHIYLVEAEIEKQTK